MSATPEASPTTKREGRFLIGFLLGCALALAIGLVGGFATQPQPPPSDDGASAVRALRVYPSGRQLSTPAELEEPVRVRFLNGIVGEGGSRAEGLEAILRLHGYLALRDVHAGPAELLWAPAVHVLGEVEPDALCGVGLESPDAFEPSSLLVSGSRPDPLGRPFGGGDDLRVRMRVTMRDGREQVEAWVCAVQGARRTEVFVSRPGAEGTLLRELGTWLALTVGTPDPGEFPASWARDPAPRGPALSTYGGLLIESMRTDDLSGRRGTASLAEATLIVPEAAWLAAWRPHPPAAPADLLRRAATLRVGFTAALEDLAAVRFAAGEVDLGLAALARLAPERERRRPVELLVAASLVEDGRPADALAVLQELPPTWRATTAAARLHALARLDLDDAAVATRWTGAWVEADRESAEALVVHARALRDDGRRGAAGQAWRKAAKMDVRWRRAAIREWAAVAAADGDEADVVVFLDELEETDGVALEPALVELRGWAALRAGDPVRAMEEYGALLAATPPAEAAGGGEADDRRDRDRDPDRARWRLARCVAAMSAGQAGDGVETCVDLDVPGLRGAQLAAAVASRSTGLLPGWRKDPKEDVEAALVAGPRDPEVAVAALHALGARDDVTTAQQQAILARWRVAAGPDIPAPALPEPVDAEPGGPDASHHRPSPWLLPH